jgi:O-antigen/teichoic acid export membrane protein
VFLKIKTLFNLNSDFSKNVLLLVTGTGVAAAIQILLSPILTRIYTPKEFGVLGLYSACVSILSVFSTGRYDLAIIEPKQDRVARMLMIISLYLSIFFSITIFLIIFFFNSFFVKILGEPDIEIWLYFLPISVFSVSCYSVFSLWMNRRKMYKEMSMNKVVSSTSVLSLSLLIGFSKVLTGGLIIGYIVGQFITIILLKNKILKKDYSLNLKRKFVTMKNYLHYPKYLVPATLASELSGSLPILLLTNFFSSTITGFFSFANRIVALPISLIGNAIGEVYRQKASEDYALYGNCESLFLQTLKKLAIMGIIPFAVLFFGGEYLFRLAFGTEWVEAGRIAKYLSFMIFFQLISTPLAFTISFNRSQKYDMILQFFRLLGSGLSFFVGYKLNSYILSISLYSAVFSSYYIMHSYIQYRAACGKIN